MVNIKWRKSVTSLKLNFRLPYYTQWGQSLLVCGSSPVLGGWDVKKGLLLTPTHQGSELIWKGSITVAADFYCEYNYFVVDDERNVLRSEAGKKRNLTLPGKLEDGIVQFSDLWQTASDGLYFRSAFKDVIFHRTLNSNVVERPLNDILSKINDPDSIVIHFKILCPNIAENTSVHVIGSTQKLGRWISKDGLKLSYAGESLWHSDCSIPIKHFPIKYNYCRMSTGTYSAECGPYRELSMDSDNKLANIISLSDGVFRERPWLGAGVAVPVFSLRSGSGLGVGEFLDLKLLVDWAVASGLQLIQLLPINDTSVNRMWWDSYPYSTLSVFALHPLYLRLEAISGSIPSGIKSEIEVARDRLNIQADVDYESSLSTKLEIARKIFSLEKQCVLASASFRSFFTENESWLKPYAVFCFLRDFFDSSDHTQWGRYSVFSPEKMEKLAYEGTPYADEIRFVYFLQYHLHLQMKEASDYARTRGVVLKGDLPIGVDRNSVDTWVNPSLFNTAASTGACPDQFDRSGQNWGFPTYNWDEMSRDNYAWWRSRLTKMADYFTAYRIDHILGFFRIWELPSHAVTGMLGKFRPAIPLSRTELEREGVWDLDRLIIPHIRSPDSATSAFLREVQKGEYRFREECDTEKKIADKLKLGGDEQRRHVFDLLQNVCLILDSEDPDMFHPRFNLQDTSSFRDLGDGIKSVLARLYCDYYFHRQEDLWRRNAMKTLPVLLDSSEMLACGEDLGLIPACVHPVMEDLGLIGLRIQRMPSQPGLEFSDPSSYGYMTVCAPSCHDCSTLRAWWEEDGDRRRRFFKNVVGSEDAPPDELVPEVTRLILRQHMESPSILAIFPIQDLLALKEAYTSRPAGEETINNPTNPRHYWRYRMHVTVEALLDDGELRQTIRYLVTESGRSVLQTATVQA